VTSSWSFILKLVKIRLVGTKLFHADRQTDRHDTLVSRFSQFWRRRLKFLKILLVMRYHKGVLL